MVDLKAHLPEKSLRPSPRKEWIFGSFCEMQVAFLKQTYEVSDVLACLVAQKGNIHESEDLFDATLKKRMPDPCVLPDMDKAMVHVYSILQQGRPLGIWGDYDVDGACASALLAHYCQRLSHPYFLYIPDRFREGYGPNQEGFSLLLRKGIRDLIVVDCGSTSIELMTWAQKQGMNVIIIDHHNVGVIEPLCHAFMNPKRTCYEGPEILKSLCAGGLVFMFLVALNRFLRQEHFFSHTQKTEPDLFSFLDLVALCTVCDMVPLRGLNRAFVKQGLKVLSQRKNIGLTSLMDTSGIREEPNAFHLGYMIGPRINAGGRIGDASLGVRLLSTQDPIEALGIAEQLTNFNTERQNVERNIEKEAKEQAELQKEQSYLFLWSKEWHEGVLGIIAGRMKELYHKPTFVLTEKGDTLKGSARSVESVDIGSLIHKACEDQVILSGGGHPMAGGLSLAKTQVPLFRTFLDGALKDHPISPIPGPLKIDLSIRLSSLQDPEFLEALDRLAPFGADFKAPLFLLSNVMVKNVISFGHNHLRLLIQEGDISSSILFFRSAEREEGQWLLQQKSCVIDAVCSAQMTRRWGKQQVQLILEDFR